ncbi:DNA cytosine methyltransferase [Roseibium sp. RP-7]
MSAWRFYSIQKRTRTAVIRPAYPIVDIFAGPGGLGEGFASFDEDAVQPRFKSVASIESNEFAHRTLHLRHFLRTFREGFPDEYYSYLKGRIEIEELYSKYPENRAHADNTALRISLGPENHDVVRSLIGTKLRGLDKWALVGGPPCQAYSLVGRSRMMGDPDFMQDVRHFLYREYLRIIIDHAPPVFVMENVKGLLSSKIDGELTINLILSDLARPKEALGQSANGLGYRLFSLSEGELTGPGSDPRLFLVRAEEFGVPQARHRMFIVGVREDIPVVPGRLKHHKPPTVRQTIGNLPSIRSGLSKGEDTFETWSSVIEGIDPVSVSEMLNTLGTSRDLFDSYSYDVWSERSALPRRSTRYPEVSRFQHPVFDHLYDSRLDILNGHEARSHMASDLKRYAFVASFAAVTGRSPKLADFPDELLPEHRNVDLGREGKMFADRFRVQLPDQPSTTITSHISKDGHYFIHYDPMQCRSLTVREAARLQTFPDNYKFEGPRTAQYHQVGNAVPSYLAKQIAAIIAEVLDAMKDGNS